MPDSPDTSAASIVRDHAFEPRTEPVRAIIRAVEDGGSIWLSPNLALCAHCRLAEAAHIR
jgi:hypothetical protein